MSNKTRRKVLVGLGTIATGGIAATVLGSDTASALEIEGFDVSDTTKHLENGDEVTDVTLSAEIAYSYDLNRTPTDVELRLLAGAKDSSPTQIAGEYISTTDLEREESIQLTGSLTSALSLDIFDFRTDDGEKTEQPISVAAELTILDGADQLHQEMVEDSAIVEIDKEGAVVAVGLGGSGEVEIET